ncbi:MAG: endonuclease III domain-containing protein [Nanobdellota archaeon]
MSNQKITNIPLEKILSILKSYVGAFETPLVELTAQQTKDPFKILITTLLSARTKDTTTALVIKKLFKEVSSSQDLKLLSQQKIEKLIYPVGFYKNKAKFLKRLPEVLEKEYGGIIPSTVDELTKLPGVGRKTANLVVASAFDKPAICVDIHVHRISNRLGYVSTSTPFETEMTLRKKLPISYWKTVNTYLVAFGQHTCTPVSPHCSTCPIERYCNKIRVLKSR